MRRCGSPCTKRISNAAVYRCACRSRCSSATWRDPALLMSAREYPYSLAPVGERARVRGESGMDLKTLAGYIKEIGRGKHAARDLSREDARALFAAMLAGEVPELQLGA